MPETQFNALSQGAGAGIMRQVEQLTTYELPSWDTSPADAPVNLCHVHDTARGGDITACVVSAGTDFSGRSGNYFAHALVTEDPQRDFGGLLPVELWESPVWSRTPADGTVLPLIPAGPPRGSLDQQAVAAFLAAQDDEQPVLARLLGGRPGPRRWPDLVLWGTTSTDNARWIAAISYLLGDARAREMSFYTYTRRPAQCRAHVIGTVPGAITSPAALADGFRVFDMTAHTLPDVTTHPAATLLAQIGVLHAAGLWRQAATLAAGTERSLDQWYPVVSAAAALLGVEPLPACAVGAMADWLPDAARRPAPLPAPHVETVLAVLLDRAGELSEGQLRRLAPAAKSAGAIGQLQRIEVTLVGRATSQLARGQQLSGPTQAATTEGIQVAVANCERLLGSADAATALAVLDWARETELKLDPRLIERCGRDVIGPSLLALDADPRIVRSGRAYPALARGLAAFITAAGPHMAPRLLRGVAGELLDANNLRGHPELRELLLLEETRFRAPAAGPGAARADRVAPAGRVALARREPTGQLVAAGADDPRRGRASAGAARRRRTRHASPRAARSGAAAAAAGRPHERLVRPVRAGPWSPGRRSAARHHQAPPHDAARLPSGTRERLRHPIKHGDMTAYRIFENRVEKLPWETRDLMRQYLSYLAFNAVRPAEQLAACAEPVFQAICGHARARLGRPRLITSSPPGCSSRVTTCATTAPPSAGAWCSRSKSWRRPCPAGKAAIAARW